MQSFPSAMGMDHAIVPITQWHHDSFLGALPGADPIPANVKTDPILQVGLSVSKEDQPGIMAEMVPSPECLKGILIEDPPTSVPIHAKERPERRDSSLLDSHALSFGLGCASSMLALVLMARRQLPPQVINVSMPAGPRRTRKPRSLYRGPERQKNAKRKRFRTKPRRISSWGLPSRRKRPGGNKRRNERPRPCSWVWWMPIWTCARR